MAMRPSDLPLKRLFTHRASDLLTLTGDDGATLLGGQSLELPSLARRLDYVLTLKRPGGEIYMRHVEFQGEAAADLKERCFEYNVRLFLHTKLPVLTTVICLHPPGPRGPATFAVRLGRHVLHHWRFEWLKLWELEAHAALTGGPGLAALLPLMHGESLDLVQAAAQRILALAPSEQQPDLLAILNLFAGWRYTALDLGRLVGRERMLESSVWREAEERGERRGAIKGRVEGEREACLTLLSAFHPDLTTRLRPAIERCADPERLKAWLVQIPRLTPDALARLITEPA